jgi:endonuclease VIII
MPEGDALHRVAARLQPLVGERVEAESPHPRGAATGVAAAVDGRVLESVEAVGKNLLLRFESGVTVRSHIRMNGRWTVRPRGAAARGGQPWLLLRGRQLEAAQWNGPVLTLELRAVSRLGPDLLADEFDLGAVVRRLRSAGARRLVGDVLVDQRFVAGIGNMWLAEGLWQARLSPWLPLADVSDDELQPALTWLRAAMRASVAGSRHDRRVYRRAGRPCPRCGEAIRSRGLGDANRTAYWCPGCQRGPEPPEWPRPSSGSRSAVGRP